ncbi:MAG: hypothetical protein ACFFCZ_13125 [Promethearchaeota archaeon]
MVKVQEIGRFIIVIGGILLIIVSLIDPFLPGLIPWFSSLSEFPTIQWLSESGSMEPFIILLVIIAGIIGTSTWIILRGETRESLRNIWAFVNILLAFFVLIISFAATTSIFAFFGALIVLIGALLAIEVWKGGCDCSC